MNNNNEKVSLLKRLQEQLGTLQLKLVKTEEDHKLIAKVTEDIEALTLSLEEEKHNLPHSQVLQDAQANINAKRSPLHARHTQLLTQLSTHQQKTRIHRLLAALLAKVEAQFVAFEDKSRDMATDIRSYRRTLLMQIHGYAVLIRTMHNNVSLINAEARRYSTEISQFDDQLALDFKRKEDNVEFIGLQTLLLSKLNKGFSVRDEKIDISPYLSMLESRSQHLDGLVSTVSKIKSPDLNKLMGKVRKLYGDCLDGLQLAAEAYDSLTLPNPEREDGLPQLIVDIYRDRNKIFVERQIEFASKVHFIITQNNDVAKALESLRENGLKPYLSYPHPPFPEWRLDDEGYTLNCAQLMIQLGRFLGTIKRAAQMNLRKTAHSANVTASWEFIFKNLYNFADVDMPQEVKDIAKLSEMKSTRKVQIVDSGNRNFRELNKILNETSRDSTEGVELMEIKGKAEDQASEEAEGQASDEKMTQSLHHGSIPLPVIIRIFNTFRTCIQKEKLTTTKADLSKLLNNLEGYLTTVIDTLTEKNRKIKEKLAEIDGIKAALKRDEKSFAEAKDRQAAQDDAAKAFSALQKMWREPPETPVVDTSKNPITDVLELDSLSEKEIQLSLEQMSREEHSFTLIEAISSINPEHPWQDQMTSFATAVRSYKEAKEAEAQKGEIKEEKVAAVTPSALRARQQFIDSLQEQLSVEEWHEPKGCYDQAMASRVQPLSAVLSVQKNLRNTNLDKLTRTIVLAILGKLNKAWKDGATKKDSHIKSLLETRLTQLEKIQLFLIKEFLPTSPSELKGRTAVVLTNKNVAHFVVEGKLVSKKQVDGINRRGLLPTESEKPIDADPKNQEDISKKEDISKIIEEAVSLSGLGLPPNTMELILPRLWRVKSAQGEELAIDFSINALNGTSSITAPDEIIVKDISDFKQACKDKKADSSYSVFCNEALVPLQTTLTNMRKKPQEFKLVDLQDTLSAVENKIILYSQAQFKRLSLCDQGWNYSKFEHYFFGSVAWFEEEIKLFSSPGVQVEAKDVEKFVVDIKTHWSALYPRFLESPIFKEFDNLLRTTVDISEKIDCIKKFLAEFSGFDRHFGSSQEEMREFIRTVPEISDFQVAYYETSIFNKLKKFGDPQQGSPAFLKYKKDCDGIKEIEAGAGKNKKKLEILVEFLKQRDSWIPVFFKKDILSKLEAEAADFADDYTGEQKSIIPTLMGSLSDTLHKFNPKILKSPDFLKLQRRIQSGDESVFDPNSAEIKETDPFVKGFADLEMKASGLATIIGSLKTIAVKTGDDPDSTRFVEQTKKNPIPKLMASLSETLKTFNRGAILKSTQFKQLEEAVAAMEDVEEVNPSNAPKIIESIIAIADFVAAIKKVAKVKADANAIATFIQSFRMLAKLKPCSRNSKIERALKGLAALAAPGKIGLEEIKDDSRPLKTLMELIQSDDVPEKGDHLVHLFKSLFSTYFNLEQDLLRFLTATQGVQQWVIELLWLSYQGGDKTTTLFKELTSEKFSNLSYTKKMNFLKVIIHQKVEEFMTIRLNTEGTFESFFRSNITPPQGSADRELLRSLVKLYEQLYSFKSTIEGYTIAETEFNNELLRATHEKQDLRKAVGRRDSKASAASAIPQNNLDGYVTEFFNRMSAEFSITPDKTIASSSRPAPPVRIDPVSSSRPTPTPTPTPPVPIALAAEQKVSPRLYERIQLLPECKTFQEAKALDNLESFLMNMRASEAKSPLKPRAIGVPALLPVSNSASDAIDHVVIVKDILADLKRAGSVKANIPAPLAKLLRHGSLQQFMNVWFSDELGKKIVPQSGLPPFPIRRNVWAPLVIDEVKTLDCSIPGRRAMQLIAASTQQVADDKMSGLVIKLDSKPLYEAVIKAYQATSIARKELMTAESLADASDNPDQVDKVVQRIATCLDVQIILYKQDNSVYATDNKPKAIYLCEGTSPGQYCPLILSSWIASNEEHAVHILLDIAPTILSSQPEEESKQDSPPRTPVKMAARSKKNKGKVPEEKRLDTPETPRSTPIPAVRTVTPLGKVEKAEVKAPASEAEAENLMSKHTLKKLCMVTEDLYRQSCLDGESSSQTPQERFKSREENLKLNLVPLVSSIRIFMKVWLDEKLDRDCLVSTDQVLSKRDVCRQYLVEHMYTDKSNRASKILGEAFFHRVGSDYYFQLQNKALEHKEESCTRAVFVMSKTVESLQTRFSNYEVMCQAMRTPKGRTPQAFLSDQLNININIYMKNPKGIVVLQEQAPTVPDAKNPTITLFKKDGKFYPMLPAKWCMNMETGVNENGISLLTEAMECLPLVVPVIALADDGFSTPSRSQPETPITPSTPSTPYGEGAYGALISTTVAAIVDHNNDNPVYSSESLKFKSKKPAPAKSIFESFFSS